MSSVPVAIALGSNLGDRRAQLSWAIGQLHQFLTNVRVSTLIETAPVDVPEPQPSYLNGMVVGETTLAPPDLLDLLLRLERSGGRTRTGVRASRTLDLDLVLYGNLTLDMPNLVVPHPRFRDRAFVLEPLVELAPDWIDPVTGQSVRQLLDRLQSSNFEVRS